MKVKSPSSLLLLGAVSVLLLSGYHRGSCGGGSIEARLERVRAHVLEEVDERLDEVEARPDQKQKIAGEVDRVLDLAVEAHRGQDAAKRALFAEWDAARPDAARVHQVVDERLAALGRIAHGLADAVLTAHATLEVEQRRALEAEVPGIGRARASLAKEE